MSHGHTVWLMAPKFVAPYRLSGKRGKRDAADAAAICEAVQRPNMRFVPVKSPEQQARLMVHRAWYGFVGAAHRHAQPQPRCAAAVSGPLAWVNFAAGRRGLPKVRFPACRPIHPAGHLPPLSNVNRLVREVRPLGGSWNAVADVRWGHHLFNLTKIDPAEKPLRYRHGTTPQVQDSTIAHT